MTAAVAVSSASGLLSLLEEEDEGLRLHALQSLNSVVHEYWYQIASSIASVEAFYEDEEFKHRDLAALVASKVRLAAYQMGATRHQCFGVATVIKFQLLMRQQACSHFAVPFSPGEKCAAAGFLPPWGARRCLDICARRRQAV